VSTRSFETLLRYRGAAMAEFWRALRTLKALQAEQAAGQAIAIGPAVAARTRAMNPKAPAARPPLMPRPRPDEPERAGESGVAYVSSEPSARGRTLHEPARRWLPNEPDTGRLNLAPNEPAPSRKAASAPARPALVLNQPGPDASE
jgi:hypothetical protein